MTMRPHTQRLIDALHNEIACLVDAEKRYAERTSPQPNALLRSIRDNSIDVAAWPPAMRANAVIATAHFPRRP